MMANQPAVYTMGDKIGECVIFNIESFLDDKNEKRTGTNNDRDMIDDTFTGFGYKTHVVNNPKEIEIKTEMKKVVEKYEKESSSSLICFILSHGTSKNKIVTYDNNEMELNEIIRISDQSYLNGKPKIFVVQACRGRKNDSGWKKDDTDEALIEFTEMMPIVTSPDFLIIYATPPGYVSYRRENDGSPFIQMLCHVLKNYRNDEPVCVLLQRLVMTISCLPLKVESKTGWFLQVPFFVSTLRKSLFLHQQKIDYIGLKKINTIVNSEAEVLRRKIVRLLHEGDSIDSDIAGYNNPQESLYHQFLLEEVSGCYDLSVDKVRYCLVINKTSVQNARNDSKKITDAMQHLKFDVQELEYKEASDFKNKLKRSFERKEEDGKQLSCLFCFILIDESELQKSDLTTIIHALKKEGCLLNRPKVYIIQRYQKAVESKTDAPTIPKLHRFVRYSTESDVIIIQVLPAKTNQDSFIQLFCKEYKESEGAVCMIEFLQHFMAEKHKTEWDDQQPTICSSMRKHLIMADSFERYAYKSESEKDLCKRLSEIATLLEKEIPSKRDISTKQDDLCKNEDEKELEHVSAFRLTFFGRVWRRIWSDIWSQGCSVM